MSKKLTYEELERRLHELEISEIRDLSRAFITLLENATDFLYFKDKEHRFTAVSQVFAELTGHKNWRDMIGKHDFEVFPVENAKVYFDAELPTMSDGEPLLDWREPYLTLEGEKGWVNTNKWPIKDELGNVIGLFGISRDITKLVKAEETLRRSEENFRQLFEHSIMGIAIHELIYDTQGCPEDYMLCNVNPAFCSILHMDADAVKGQKASDIYGTKPAPLLSEFASVVKTKKTIDFEFFFEPFSAWYKVKAYSHQTDSFVTVFEDITDAKKIQEERDLVISQLESALAEVKALSGLLPICSSCKKIRDDKGYWNQIESYIQTHSEAEFSHSICPECSDKLYGNEDWYIELKKKGRT